MYLQHHLTHPFAVLGNGVEKAVTPFELFNWCFFEVDIGMLRVCEESLFDSWVGFKGLVQYVELRDVMWLSDSIKSHYIKRWYVTSYEITESHRDVMWLSDVTVMSQVVRSLSHITSHNLSHTYIYNFDSWVGFKGLVQYVEWRDVMWLSDSIKSRHIS